MKFRQEKKSEKKEELKSQSKASVEKQRWHKENRKKI